MIPDGAKKRVRARPPARTVRLAEFTLSGEHRHSTLEHRASPFSAVCAKAIDLGQTDVNAIDQNRGLSQEEQLVPKEEQKGARMGELAQFIALPIDMTDAGLVAGEPFKCASPTAAIERAKGYWQVFGHAGAIAFVRTGYPDSQTTVLRRFGNVPDELEI
jgi:hypothetical protein